MASGKSNTKLTVNEYKKLFDENNYKKNNFQIALFIKFLTEERVKIKEIENLTGIEKSQIHNYKKIIKMGRVNELKSSGFRDVIKNCTTKNIQTVSEDPVPPNAEPTLEDDLVQEIENVSNDDDEPYVSCPESPDIHPRAHYFNEIEYSPGRTSFRKKDMCDKCNILEVGGDHLPGQKEIHIPDLGISVHSFRRLTEIVEHESEVARLKEKISELEAKLEQSEEENRKLRGEKV